MTKIPPSQNLTLTTLIPQFLFDYHSFLPREVFKAQERKGSRRLVALKKVMMDNEKEGVLIFPTLNNVVFVVCT